MAYRDHPQIELHEGDTVVFSATPIPGNERAVNETIDRLYQIGCEVITPRDEAIHASGHGYQEELKLMLNLTRPRYVMPVHGDFKRVRIHSQLAQAVGVPAENIFQGENGLPLEITASGAAWGKPETAGMIFVDGVDIGDVADVALRDRRMLSADGIFIIVATVSEQDGSSVVAPEVLARGVPFLDGNADFVDDLREAVEDSLDRAAVRADHRDRRARVDAPRRPRELHLRQAQAAADGAAGRRRGLGAKSRCRSTYGRCTAMHDDRSAASAMSLGCARPSRWRVVTRVRSAAGDVDISLVPTLAARTAVSRLAAGGCDA